MNKLPPEVKQKGLELLANGGTAYSVAKELEINYATVRCWIDPAFRQDHIASASEFSKNNKDHVNAYQRTRAKNMTREQKEKRNAYQRRIYIENPRVKETMARLAAKYRNTAQGRLSDKVRLGALGYCNRFPLVFAPLMLAGTGMTKEEFTRHIGTGEQVDHIVPLIKFDLTNPIHLLKAIHPTNVRSIPKLHNQRKGKKCPDINIDLLPMIETDDAITHAKAFIARQLSYLKKDDRNDSRERENTPPSDISTCAGTPKTSPAALD